MLLLVPTLWNSLPPSMRDPSRTLTQLCTLLRTVLFCKAYATSLTIPDRPQLCHQAVYFTVKIWI